MLLEKIPLFALSVMSVVMTVSVPEKVTANDHFDLPTRIANTLDSYIVYLRQTFWPVDLVANYSVVPIPLWQQALWLVILVAITAGAISLWKKRPYVPVGWLWFAGMLVPVIGIVQISFYAHADRYTYLPQVGLCIAVTWSAADFFATRPSKRWIPATLAALVLGPFMFLAWKQTATWRNSTALWQHALTHSRDNAVAHYSLGDVFIKNGNAADAIVELRRALEIKPKYPFALNALGNVLMAQGKYDEASGLFNRALDLQPDYAAAQNNLGNLLFTLHRPEEAIVHLKEAARLSPIFPEAQNNWGNALVLLGRTDEAIEHYRKANEINPDYVTAYANMGNALAAVGRHGEAIAALQKAVALRPRDATVRYNLANVLLMKEDNAHAAGEYRRVIEIQPDFADAHSNYGTALAGLGKADEAIEQYRRAVEINPNNPESRNNLGVSLGSRGNIGEAIEQYRRAIEINPGYVAAQINLGAALANDKQLDDAIKHLREASRLTGEKDPGLLDTLATVLAMNGQPTEAISIAQRAADLAAAQGNAALATKIRAHLDAWQH